MNSEPKDYWQRIKEDGELSGVLRKLSMHELRLLYRHARDSLKQSTTGTFESFLEGAEAAGAIDLSVRIERSPEGELGFYIHPANKAGDTADFAVSGDLLSRLTHGAGGSRTDDVQEEKMMNAAAKTYAKKLSDGSVETGPVVEQTIYATVRASVIQSAYGDTLVYRVMSSNGICLEETISPAKAVEYADWFTAKNPKAA